MASHEHLEGLGNSSSSEGDDGDASTSSEDENTTTIANSNGPQTMKIDSNDGDAMLIDSPSSATKPRIKLTLRASITPANGDTEMASAGSNGIKTEDNVTERPLAVKQEQAVASSPSPSSAQDIPPTGKSVVAVEQSLTPPLVKPAAKGPSTSNGTKTTDAFPKAVSDGKVLKKPEAKIKKDSKVKKEDKAKTEPGTNGASKTSPSLDPPKKKTKKKLPLGMKRKLPLKSSGDKAADSKSTSSTATSTVVKATVVGSDEVVDAEAVATVVESGPAPAAKPSNKVEPAKRRPQHHTKPIRVPPMTSPGLLIAAANAGMYRSTADSTGFTTPATIFEQSMASAGYTTEARMKDPHRGSSVQRVVGDMFDSDVHFTLNFPQLVPEGLWSQDEDKEKGSGEDKGEPSSKPKKSLPQVLLNSLFQAANGKAETQDQTISNGKESNSRKRQRPWQFSDMVPVSLTIPYPDSYIEKRLKYVKDVDDREQAIIEFQLAQEKLEIEQEEKEILHGKDEEDDPPKINKPVKIPPIPVPPPPPPLSEFKGIDETQYEGTPPIYFPKGKQTFVAHLDKNCFHVTEGRYFGLSSNTVADPHFVGANAPGILGITVSCGSGLATSSTSSGIGISASASVLAVAPSAIKTKDSTNSEKKSSDKTPKKEASTKPTKKTASLPTVAKSGTKSKFKLKHVGPTPTANASDLRKVMEEGGGMALQMKKCIIRAAVHASRSGKHGQSFLAPDGKAYPDVSKAFAAHAELKPCARCKNNKQGAYHCRLRRKHTEDDHDGSKSFSELEPLLKLPLEDLLLDPKTF